MDTGRGFRKRFSRPNRVASKAPTTPGLDRTSFPRPFLYNLSPAWIRTAVASKRRGYIVKGKEKEVLVLMASSI